MCCYHQVEAEEYGAENTQKTICTNEAFGICYMSDLHLLHGKLSLRRIVLLRPVTEMAAKT